jgi:hypothetical protein
MADKLDSIGDQDAVRFYQSNYDLLAKYIVTRGPKRFLGKRENQTCRFCGARYPKATFNNLAHAVPECLGNHTLFSMYECDECNTLFGNGIENDFGNWSKPTRTLGRIRGKNGVPTIKSRDGRLRVEGAPAGLAVNHEAYQDIFEVNEERRELTFRLVRDSYTPVGVLKAFVKMGLTIFPDAEMPNFGATLAWIREKNHALGNFSLWPTVRTFMPRAFGGNLISLMALRRKTDGNQLPYAVFVIIYGNELFQVFIPCPERDRHLDGKTLSFLPFPSPIDFQSPANVTFNNSIDLRHCISLKSDRLDDPIA